MTEIALRVCHEAAMFPGKGCLLLLLLRTKVGRSLIPRYVP